MNNLGRSNCTLKATTWQGTKKSRTHNIVGVFCSYAMQIQHSLPNPLAAPEVVSWIGVGQSGWNQDTKICEQRPFSFGQGWDSSCCSLTKQSNMSSINIFKTNGVEMFWVDMVD